MDCQIAPRSTEEALDERKIPEHPEFRMVSFSVGDFECTAIWDGYLLQPYQGI
jgi:hypothetical protein